MSDTETPAVTEEEQLLSHLYKALNEVPSCGCGWPDEARQLVWDILTLMPTYGAEKKQRLAELIGPEASQQIVLSAIEGAGLISHGTSITSSWLEPRGRWVLWAVEQVGGIDGLHAKLEDTGFPHEWDRELKDMQPCTDACWAMPDGWEPAPKLIPTLIDPVVFVRCPGPSCVSYQYGADHQHTARPS